jgi:hypothetical protein
MTTEEAALMSRAIFTAILLALPLDQGFTQSDDHRTEPCEVRGAVLPTECMRVEVPEDWENPAGRSIELTVAVT